MKDSSNQALASLKSTLQALSLSPDAQIALFPSDRCVPCTLSLMFVWWSREFQRELSDLDRKRQMFESLEEAAQNASRSHQCHDNDAVHTGPAFMALRQIAASALLEFGWATGSPDRQYVPGTPEHAARCEQAERKRKQRQHAARKSAKTELRYHHALFAALGVTPAVSRRNEQLLREREQNLGIRFPEAIFEFLSIEGIVDLFREHSNADELVTNDDFDEWRKLERFGNISEIQQGYLRVAVENQGVVAFYVRLDGSADPPVFHNNDQWAEDLSTIDWVAVADRFSTFVRQMMGQR